jgi:hypothetical protein
MRRLLFSILALIILAQPIRAARQGNTGTGAFGNTNPMTETDSMVKYSYTFHYMNTANFSTTNIERTMMWAAGAPNLDFGFSWGHPTAGFRHAAYQLSDAGYKASQISGMTASNTWYWVGAVWDGTNLVTYLNGAADGSVGATTLSRTDLQPNFFLLGYTGNTIPDGGIIEHIAFWPGVALTAGEVASVHAGAHPRSVRGSGLLLYYPLRGDHSPETNESHTTNSYNITLNAQAPAQYVSWPTTQLLFQGIR